MFDLELTFSAAANYQRETPGALFSEQVCPSNFSSLSFDSKRETKYKARREQTGIVFHLHKHEW